MSRCFSAGLLCVGLVLSAHGADRVELNDGWLFTPEEAIAPGRAFAIPAMLDMLDGQRRDLLETPRASRVPVGAEPGEGHPYLKPDFKAKGWAPVRVPHGGARAGLAQEPRGRPVRA